MENMARGDGCYVNTSNPNQLADIFEDIANALPIQLVR